jgi:hypothetical protein
VVVEVVAADHHQVVQILQDPLPVKRMALTQETHTPVQVDLVVVEQVINQATQEEALLQQATVDTVQGLVVDLVPPDRPVQAEALEQPDIISNRTAIVSHGVQLELGMGVRKHEWYCLPIYRII